ncbi:arylsulfotransferase family protein [Microbaculum marinum]|uniref:Arylsulfotransferase family protein n=1 Tax=Microbaculum marinum TaxID=1764581 RepID=A0AAW9RHM9_9HYPH
MILCAVLFGWIVKTALQGYREPGPTAKLALAVAGAPSEVEAVLSDLWQYANGSYEDNALRTPRQDRDFSGFRPISGSEAFGIEGLMIGQVSNSARYGWRIVLGAFSMNGRVENAALVLSPDMAIERVWVLDEPSTVGLIPAQPAYRKFIHGFQYLSDGSFIFTLDGGVSLQRFDACGKRMWASPGYYSHSVNLADDEQSVWTVGTDEIVQIAVADGAVIRTIGMQEIVDANPEIDVFQIRRLADNDLGGNSRNTDGNWLPDPHHINDVEPLPARLADSYRELGFAAGDLLMSARSSNLVFVLDPQTLRVKWWRIGATQRQHDPDWEEDGTFSIFNNRMSRDYSEIVKLDPRTMQRQVLVDGRNLDFYSRIRGKHQVLPDGNVIVTSAQQGRAFEITPEGEMAFEIVNFRPGDEAVNYVLSEVLWLPPDRLDPTQTETAPCSD